MYTLTKITALPSGFGSLVEQSIPAMDSGTFDWDFIGSPTTVEEKKSSLREAFEVYLDAPYGFVMQYEKDNHLIQINTGLLTPEDPSYILWTLNVCGDDSAGTKAWMHEPDYVSAARQFMHVDHGLSGYKIVCYKNQSLYNYHLGLSRLDTVFSVTEENESVDPSNGMTITTLKFTYL